MIQPLLMLHASLLALQQRTQLLVQQQLVPTSEGAFISRLLTSLGTVQHSACLSSSHVAGVVTPGLLLMRQRSSGLAGVQQ
jgi:hypothetical protein